MNREIFLDCVTKAIREKDTKESVAKELNHHIEEVMKGYVEQGFTVEDAEQKAIEQMGSAEKLSKKFNKLYKRKIEWSVLTLFICTIGIGIIPMLLFKNFEFPFSWPSKILGIVIGIGLVICLFIPNYRKWERYSLLFFGLGTFILMFATLNDPLVVTVNGQPRLHFGPFMTDTSIVLILYLIPWASFLLDKKIKGWMLSIFIIFTSVLIFYIGLSYSNLAMYVFMLVIMYGVSRKDNLMKVSLVIVSWIVVGGSLFVMNVPSYQINRLLLFLDPQANPNGMGYVSSLAKKMIDKTTWFPQPITKKDFPIQEFQTDMVFTTITYSLGWGISLLLLAILAFFLIRLILLTKRIIDPFGKMLIVGAISLFLFQILYNIGMSFGLLPFAGVSLPFISYGSTPLIFNSILIGIILSVYSRKDSAILPQMNSNEKRA
ncbi:FtsW/RodA/SpoVE family cell cycle protein [Bacillus massiliigorillae]|uniref:FtsW/RodA/SpoVE family cell cycle protein n=1 Tax=Bacillus massiliigorillae TaxID=1243664 RepID=UPI0003A7E714|nr:FtsW/RodA/SpoVE family cell cycle protein [Bacillus massiliigorillae]